MVSNYVSSHARKNAKPLKPLLKGGGGNGRGTVITLVHVLAKNDKPFKPLLEVGGGNGRGT